MISSAAELGLGISNYSLVLFEVKLVNTGTKKRGKR